MKGVELTVQRSETEQKIRLQLLTMMRKSSITSIKVSHLVDSLGICRSTFYLYYSSIYDVLQQIEDDFITEFEAAFTKDRQRFTGNYDKYADIPLPSMVAGLNYVKSSEPVFSVLWGRYGDKVFQRRVMNLIANQKSLHMVSKQKNPELEELHFAFILEGWKAVILSWLKNTDSVSSEEMAMLLCQILAKNMLPLNTPYDHIYKQNK